MTPACHERGRRLATASAIGTSPEVSSTAMRLVGLEQSGGDEPGDIATRHGTVRDRRARLDATGGRVVEQGAGPNDEPVQIRRGELDVSLALDRHVVLEAIRSLLTAQGVHEHRDQDEPAHPGGRRRLGGLAQALTVYRRGLVHAGAVRTRAEHDRVVTGETLSELPNRVGDQVPGRPAWHQCHEWSVLARGSGASRSPRGRDGRAVLRAGVRRRRQRRSERPAVSRRYWTFRYLLGSCSSEATAQASGDRLVPASITLGDVWIRVKPAEPT